MSSDPAAAPAGRYKVDEGHTSLLARTRHASSGYTVLRFNTVKGTLDWSADLTGATVAIEIDPKSIDSPVSFAPGGGTFAQMLVGPQWLDAYTHGKATFVSTKVTKKDGARSLVEGNLTLKGVTRPIVIETEFLAAGNNGRATAIAFTGRTTINRRDFGITTLPGNVVGDEVQLLIDIEFNKEQ